MVGEINLHKELELLKSKLYYIEQENTIIVKYLCRVLREKEIDELYKQLRENEDYMNIDLDYLKEEYK